MTPTRQPKSALDDQLPERCSDREFDRRHDLLRRRMRDAGIDVCLCYGTYQGWQNVLYLSNHWDLISCWLIFPRESDPVLLIGIYPHLECVRRFSVIKDTRFGGGRSIALIKDELARRGLDASAIAFVEPDTHRVPGIPHGTMAQLREVLPNATFTAFTPCVEEIRRRKSPEEQDILRLSAALTDRTLEQVVAAVRPGVTEAELAHVIAGAPGDTVAVLVGSTTMTRPDLPYPAIRPSNRTLSQGDVVMVELSKGCAGYAGQLHGTITLGAPTERYERLHETAYSAYRSICDVLREGCTPDEIVRAGSIIPERGYLAADPLVHGFAMGIEPGLFVGLPDSPAYWPNATFVFPAGASVTLEPNPCEADMKAGATAGALVLVQQDRCEKLHPMADAGIIVV